jgi:hypothetical protein
VGNKPDPDLWEAMAREQVVSARVARLESVLAGSRDDGDERMSVAVCHAPQGRRQRRNPAKKAGRA